jgi:hypothetical protein
MNDFDITMLTHTRGRLQRPTYSPRRQDAPAAGKALIGSSDALTASFAQALAGGAVLALVAHAMIPVALEEGGSLVVLPTVAGFLFALYLALAKSFV